jgi:adenine deaminase
MQIHANVIHIVEKKIFEGVIEIKEDKIISITKKNDTINKALPYACPGFIDSHVHIESSMLTPTQFARMAVVHGTVATISDPHEIANVCGMQGVLYMIEDGNKVPFKFYFGAPSCVPATTFETAGAAITVDEVNELLQRDDIKYLSEMMNFPGVLYDDAAVMAKINLAKKYKKPVDGHAPGLIGEVAKTYIEKISIQPWSATDHECFTAAEALHKLQHGMKIIIREGSAAKNFEALAPLINDWSSYMMFCSDDKHPDSLAIGHINQLCARAVALEIDVFKVLQVACINPVNHYNLEVGTLQVGDYADFVLLNSLETFEIAATYINGKQVAQNGKANFNVNTDNEINNFNCSTINAAQLQIFDSNSIFQTQAIVALDGQLITNRLAIELAVENNIVQNDLENDILKIVVVNRYFDAPVAKAFIKNVGLKKGAIACSVAHDSHNIVCVGVDDVSMTAAINTIIEHKGGLSYAVQNEVAILPLPVAGIMTTADGYIVAEQYTMMDNFVKQELGTTLQSPYMTLSFMALLVIPHLKISDKGLFDGDSFQLID